MNKSRLLSTTAAVLMLGAGAAYAQAPAPQKGDAPAQPAPVAQQHAPAEKVAPSIKAGEAAKPATAGQTAEKPEPGHGQSAQSGGHNGAPDAAAKADMKGSADTHKADIKTNADANKKAEGANADAAKKAEGANARSTTGQGAAAGSAKLSTEQRTKITSIIRQKKVAPVHLNVSISIGTRIPEHVHYYPLPTEVVTIYPEWRGYDYILVGDQIVVIDPGTQEIVAVLEA